MTYVFTLAHDRREFQCSGGTLNSFDGERKLSVHVCTRICLVKRGDMQVHAVRCASREPSRKSQIGVDNQIKVVSIATTWIFIQL
jgi:hypothetical protein